jgi:prepilin-type N-terminal cleavage/methylation domain-containing protein
MTQQSRKTLPAQRPTRPTRGRAAFTLIEVLLACSVLGLIATAVIMNFTNLLDGQHLEEGASRVESLVRMTKAQSALQGKRLRLLCDAPAGKLSLEWEPNPATEPGKFVAYDRLPIGVQSIAEHVKVVSCAVGGPEGSGEAKADGPTMIYFDPDGSCDGFTLDLASVSEKDVRHAHVQLYAFDGSIGTQISSPADDEAAADAAPQ